MIEQVAQAILAKMLEMDSEIAGHPVEADEFAEMCAYEYASAALSEMEAENKRLREALKPFAAPMPSITMKDFHRARAALEHQQHQQKGEEL